MKQFSTLLTILLLIAAWIPQQAIAVDADGDGHASIASGGDDCDDHDGNRYPGNAEVCDADHHDEDCNPFTFAYRNDRDGDGLLDHRCCNIAANGQRNCGNDCDDDNRAVQTNSQVCDGEQVFLCTTDGNYARASCPQGTICVVQPNRTGVCMTKPPGYVAPPSRGLANQGATPPATLHRVKPAPHIQQPANRLSPVKPAPPAKRMVAPSTAPVQ